MIETKEFSSANQVVATKEVNSSAMLESKT